MCSLYIERYIYLPAEVRLPYCDRRKQKALLCDRQDVLRLECCHLQGAESYLCLIPSSSPPNHHDVN